MREVKKSYWRVNGEWRNIVKLYWEVDNKARQFWPKQKSIIPVMFVSVTANGSASVTSTTLTLKFGEAIEGLTAADISLSGIDGLVKGALSGTGPTYTLAVSGFTSGGTLTVEVEKAGYEIDGYSKTVNLFYAVPVTFSSVSANGSSAATSTTLTLTFNKAITGLAAGDISLSGITGLVKGTLSGSGPTYTLGISGFTAGGTLTVAVAKEGYEITNPSRTVTVYYAVAVTFSSVTADGSASATTSKLTLTFDKAIDGLTASNITLSGVSGITKGTLSASGSTYTLQVSGLTASGTLTVAVSRTGYAISGSPKTVGVYNGTFSRTTAASLSGGGRRELAAVSIGNYALFGGGITDSMGASFTASVAAYDASLTHNTAQSLSTARGCLAATCIGNYALFGGGKRSNSDGLNGRVDAYDSSLTRITPAMMQRESMHIAASSVGNYAIFCLGTQREVYTYDTSLTLINLPSFDIERSNAGAASIGNYALFGGGRGDSGIVYSTVDVFNSSLTRSTATPLAYSLSRPAATTVGNYALFGGHSAYDSSLTRTLLDRFNMQSELAATTVGNYALFGGGYGNSHSAVVDAYEI
jgi:hypothetical protein